MSAPCVACGYLGPDDARFCVRCGAALTAPAPEESQGDAVAQAALVLQGLTKRCDRCGMANDASVRFCHYCGWDLAETPLVSSVQLRPAGLWIRLGAYLLDVILLAVAVGVGTAAAVATGAMTEGNQVLTNLASQVGTVFYFTVSVGTRGASLGKWALGLRIVRKDGTRVSLPRALCRYLALSAVFLPSTIGVLLIDPESFVGLGDRPEAVWEVLGSPSSLLIYSGLLTAIVFVIWLGVSKQRRGWHDLLAGTRVIRVR
ncbi:MAG: RDD family protein [Dehalococcoidia bacterium]|nr:RDD family protein [Dehalococcoidia bacterium]